jgi:tetratricopeptide (TPR) repeat protein
MSHPDLKLLSEQTNDLPVHQVNAQAQKLYQEGNDRAFRKDHHQAIEYYTQALALNDRFVEAYCARGQSAIELQDYKLAKNDYTTALKLSPGLAIAYGGLARTYYGFRDYTAALIACNHAIQNDIIRTKLEGVPNLEFHLCRAVISKKIADYPQILSDCKPILEHEPHHIPARWLNAIAHFHLGNYKLALFNFDRYINLKSNDFYAHYYRGMCHERLDDLPQALVDFNLAIELQGDRATFYRKRGHVRQKLGDLTAAMTDYDEAIRLDPRMAEAYSRRADIYISRGDLAGALMECDRSIQLNPKLISAYYQRGVINTEFGNLHAALADYHRLIQLNPQDLNAYIQRGWIYFRHGEYPAAMEDCDRVLEIDRDSIPANYLLGVVRSLSGFKQEAIFSFTRAIDLHPNFVCALYHRGLLRHDLKDVERAMDDFKAAQEIQNQGLESVSVRDETGLYAEGLALYQMGHSATSKVILHQAGVISQRLKSTVFYQQIAFTIEALGMN